MKSKHVLFSILNWGLGHAARSVPIINTLKQRGHQIVLGSDGRAGKLLQKDFPDLPFIELPSYNARYSKKNFLRQNIRLAYRISRAVRREHTFVKELVKKYDVDVIISDNRYGMYHHNTGNILISHQINIPLQNPWRQLANARVQSYINRFDVCWVPDLQGANNLSGDLSERALSTRVRYIGPQSRFRRVQMEPSIDLTIVLSGPEPQRSILEKKLLSAVRDLSIKVALVQGKTELETKEKESNGIRCYANLTGQELNQLLNQSRVVVSRMGYSTIMDLLALQKPAILIPTPGQPEQMYLAMRHRENPLFEIQYQGHLDIISAYERLIKIKPKWTIGSLQKEDLLNSALLEMGL